MNILFFRYEKFVNIISFRDYFLWSIVLYAHYNLSQVISI